MKIGIVAPSPVPFTIGGAEKLTRGLARFINNETSGSAEIIKLPSPEKNFWEIVDSYRKFSQLDLKHLDLVISGKYPAWMVRHPRHVCYMLHRLRGLYDTYPASYPQEVASSDPRVMDLVRFLRSNHGNPLALEGCFAQLDVLRKQRKEDGGLFAHPNPLGREVVHFLDSTGLSPEEVQRFFAISHTVARRGEYFPEGVPVAVAYPPSDLEGFRCQGDDFLFTASRLDGPKRISLLIEAMQHCREDIDLLIAGTGPQEAALREQAGEDRRIRFLGFVPDQELLDLYAHSLAVLFVPQEEDFGLITVEAMKSAKPVVTAIDSGGPVELVRDGENGFVASPEPAALGEKIQYLCRNRKEAREMGQAAHRSVQGIEWTNVAQTLLPDLPPRSRRSAPSSSLSIHRTRRRPKMTIATTFPISPVRGGGQARIFHLFRQLAAEVEVEVVSLDAYGSAPECIELAAGFRELRVPRSGLHEARQAEISEEVGWIPVTDVAMPLLYTSTPAYVETLRSSAAGADRVIASHPYVYPAIREAYDGEIWYEAQDVEVELKSQLFPDSPAGRRLVALTREVEERCCREARRILVCSPRDLELLGELYGVDEQRCLLVPNGVDTGAVRFVSPPERSEKKALMGLEHTPVAIFVGSWHEPNLDAVRQILDIAPRVPEVRFVVVGGVGAPFADERVPSNVGFMGVVEDSVLQKVLGTADMALNPMRLGSGTNLKVLEYCAAGLPVLSTQYGLRGLELRHDDHVEVAPAEEFPSRIQYLATAGVEVRQRVSRARHLVEKRYDWSVIAQALRRAMN